MEMTRLEKRLVNRRSKARFNIDLLRRRLDDLDLRRIHNVLELGCGVGYVSAYLASEVRLKVIGTDFDPAQIDSARRLHGERELLRFQAQDASQLDFEDGSFDLVISQHVFHHITAWQQVVREITRVLREGGYVIWLDLALPAFIKKVLQPWGKRYGLYTLGEVKTEMQRCGLSQVFYEKLVRCLSVHHHLVLQKE
ncbi:MAG: class I SAM-dependent methyltransferase [bacterium]